MDGSADTQIRSHLGPGERLLWSGRPLQGFLFRPADLFAIPFSLLWGGFAFFWEYSVVTSDAPFFFRLWGIPFVAAGLYIIAGRFFVDAKQRAATFYGVTNQRVVIVSGLMSRIVKSLNLRTLSDLSLDQKAGGCGTIAFGGSSVPLWFPTVGGWPGMPSPGPRFEFIEDASSVLEIIRKAQSAAA